MSDRVVIKSADRGALLEFFAVDKTGSFRARLRGEGFEGTVAVSPYQTLQETHIPAFFRDLAFHWRGWSGKKSWGALDGKFSLSATIDSTGHIHLDVELLGGACYDWRLRGSLVIEAGQLDPIANQIERFMRLGHAA
jgi:hypothetical protein